MRTFRNLLTAFGAMYILAVCIGSAVPGMNFHVVLADDKTALEYHEEQAKRLRARIEKEE